MKFVNYIVIDLNPIRMIMGTPQSHFSAFVSAVIHRISTVFGISFVITSLLKYSGIIRMHTSTKPFMQVINDSIYQSFAKIAQTFNGAMVHYMCYRSRVLPTLDEDSTKFDDTQHVSAPMFDETRGPSIFVFENQDTIRTQLKQFRDEVKQEWSQTGIFFAVFTLLMAITIGDLELLKERFVASQCSISFFRLFCIY